MPQNNDQNRLTFAPIFKLAAIVSLGLAACSQAPGSSELEQDESAALSGSFGREIKAIADGSKFTQIYRRQNGVPAYGHKKHTSVRSVMVCLHHRYGTRPELGRLETMMRRVQGYFTTSSQGRFRLEDTTFVGCGGTGGTLVLPPEIPAGYHDGILREALEAAAKERGFDFSVYDSNQDGTITGDEAVITVMLPQDGQHPNGPNVAGAHRWVASSGLGSVGTVDVIDASFQGNLDLSDKDLIEKFGTMAHEIMHQTFDADDMYDSPMFGAGWFSLMDRHFGAGHLDPFHKLKLGWLNPRAYTYSGAQTFTLRNIETTGDVVVLYDPAVETGEYFIVENRSAGLVLWRIVENSRRLYMVQSWSSAYAGALREGLWGRYAIHRVTEPLTAANGDSYHMVSTEGLGPFVVREVSRDATGRSVVEVAYRPGN